MKLGPAEQVSEYMLPGVRTAPRVSLIERYRVHQWEERKVEKKEEATSERGAEVEAAACAGAMRKLSVGEDGGTAGEGVVVAGVKGARERML